MLWSLLNPQIASTRCRISGLLDPSTGEFLAIMDVDIGMDHMAPTMRKGQRSCWRTWVFEVGTWDQEINRQLYDIIGFF